MNLRNQLCAYAPFNEQEARDRDRILQYMDAFADIFSRENPLCHMTASAWVVNPARDRVLMAYHNIYQSWAWLGGHADGERDLLSVALREAREESGVQNVRPASQDIYSIEILTVDGHKKRGMYVSSHLHLNITYLIEADDRDATTIKPDENSGVQWLSLDNALRLPTEPWMVRYVYQKLVDKLAAF